MLGEEVSDETLLNTAVSMNGDYINVQVPIELGPVETMVSMDYTASVTDQQLTLNLERARLGHLPIPRSLVASKIAEKVNQEGTGATMSGNHIQVTLPTMWLPNPFCEGQKNGTWYYKLLFQFPIKYQPLVSDEADGFSN